MTNDQLTFLEELVERASSYGHDHDCTAEIHSREEDHIIVTLLDENDDEPTMAKVEILAVEHSLLDRSLLRVTILGDKHPQIIGASGRMLFAALYV